VRLAKAGKSVAEIAATFGLTEVLVKRRLALGNLLPKIREACRCAAIDAETARHLTLASKAQQRDWLARAEDRGPIVTDLFGAEGSSADALEAVRVPALLLACEPARVSATARGLTASGGALGPVGRRLQPRERRSACRRGGRSSLRRPPCPSRRHVGAKRRRRHAEPTARSQPFLHPAQDAAGGTQLPAAAVCGCWPKWPARAGFTDARRPGCSPSPPDSSTARPSNTPPAGTRHCRHARLSRSRCSAAGAAGPAGAVSPGPVSGRTGGRPAGRRPFASTAAA